MQRIDHQKYRILSSVSVGIGVLSLLLFLSFVVFGPFSLISLDLSDNKKLFLNSLLSSAFFTQHSLMIRKTMRKIVDSLLPKESFSAFYAIISGILLGTTVLFWQQTDRLVITIAPPFCYFLNLLSLFSTIGLLWAVSSLTDFDPFGRKQITNYLTNRPPKKQVFVLRGAYKFTRHPFYFFILVMMWSYPVVTVDRLLFLVIWTTWVLVGTVLEERDLVEEIGDDYRKYQKTVAMFVPYKLLNTILQRSRH